MAAADELVLVADSLCWGAAGVSVLEDVSLELTAGQRLAVVGPSGAGKSTLMQLLAGELRPAKGTVRLDGNDVSAWPLWRRARAGLGYVPQGSSVLPDLSVARNVDVYLEQPTCRGKRDWAAELLRELELEGRRDTLAGSLSGGERRRLELLRALLAEPRILLLDEPFAGLDPRRAHRLAAMLTRALSERRTALLVADHRMAETLSLADEAVLLLDGRLRARSPSGEFPSHPDVLGRYLPE